MRLNNIHFIIVIIMLSRICSASSLYPALSGNPADPVWTIYLSSATLDGKNLQSGDSIAFFDANRLVGSFVLTEVLMKDRQYQNFINIWSTLNDGPGYASGHQYSIKCWDSDQQTESTSFSIQFDTSVNDSYNGQTFPQGDGRFSITALTFETQSSSSPFKIVSGDPSQSTWTIYLSNASLEDLSLQVNDEIAIYCNSNQVGFFKLNHTLSAEKWHEQYITVWSALAEGQGYIAGQPFEFRLWDDSDRQIYSRCSIAYDQTDGAYNGQVFPSGDAPFSVVNITFEDEHCFDEVLKERLRYDPSGDGVIGLEEAIHALQVMSGM